MVTVPRYTGSLGRDPIRSGRTLKTGTAGADALMKLGNTLSNELFAYNERKIEIDRRLRDQEITDKGLIASADTQTALASFEEYAKTVDDYNLLSPEYEKRWKRNTDRIVKNHFTSNGVFDEYAYKQYEAKYGNFLYVDGLQRTNSIKYEKRVNQTKNAFNTLVNTGIDSFNNSTSAVGLSSAYTTVSNEIDSYRNILPAENIIEAKNLIEQAANRKTVLIQAGYDLPENSYIDPFGEVKKDYIQIYENLQKGEFLNSDGKPFDKSDPVFKALLDEMNDESRDQEYYEGKLVDRQNNKLVTDNFAKVLNGDLTTKDIRNLNWPNTAESRQLQNNLVDIAINRKQGLIPTESNIDIYRKVKQQAITVGITSVTEKSYMPTDDELANFTPDKVNEYRNGMSVLDLVSESVFSEADYMNINRIISDPVNTRNSADLDRAISAYVNQVQGDFKDIDKEAEIRSYYFTKEVENKFAEGIEKGIAAKDLLDPFGDDFVITPEIINKYVLTGNEQFDLILEQTRTEKEGIEDLKTNDDMLVTGEWTGPNWQDFKYNEDTNPNGYKTFQEFVDGPEMTAYKATDEYKQWEEQQEDTVVKKEVKSSDVNLGGKNFTIYDNGDVEPRPKTNNRDPMYAMWMKNFGATHNADGTKK
jgi:hypothetical protein